MMVALLGACAHYRPLPLDVEPAPLKSPAGAALARAAATIDGPFLAPTSIDLGEPLDANAVAVIAVIANPDLKALRLRAGIADAQAFAAGLLPDPTFSLGVDKVLSGPDQLLNIAGALGLELNALRTRPVELAKARARVKQVRLDLAWAEWQTAGQARLQAVRVAGLERGVGLAAASRDATQVLLERMLRAAGRGDLTADQVHLARLAALDAAERYRNAARELATAHLELTRLLGLPPRQLLQLASAPLPADPPSAEQLLTLAQTGRTDLQALEAGYLAQEAAVRKAVLDQFPALGLTINPSRDSAGNTLLGPAVTFTLPLWNRNRGGIAIEQATREALKSEYEARVFQARAEIAAAINGIELAKRQRADFLRELPAIVRFAAASRDAAKRGDLALATADATEQVLRDKQILLAKSEQDLREQTIALELLTGTRQETWTR
ncbi:MAG: TolC family protein [Gammaproteobacteria bacterium]|nr:TolC family protein [Gammaproteobacteria bacterium]